MAHGWIVCGHIHCLRGDSCWTGHDLSHNGTHPCADDDVSERLTALMDGTHPDDMLPLSGEWRVLFATCGYTERGDIHDITVSVDGMSILVGRAEYTWDEPGHYSYLGSGWWYLTVMSPTLIEFVSDTHCERQLEWVTPAQ